MDVQKTGRFLKALRQEKGLTQEQLGEKIDVSNKTISRWETGSYMPPVECLALLSELYGVSINEIVSGQRLSGATFPAAAEENLSNALAQGEMRAKKTEKQLMASMLLSTAFAIAIILLLPIKQSHVVTNIVIIALVSGLALIGNTVNLAALALNKERSGKRN